MELFLSLVLTQDLEAVKGLGKVLAGRILAARSAEYFQDWEDFTSRKIEKFGPKRLQVRASRPAGVQGSLHSQAC